MVQIGTKEGKSNIMETIGQEQIIQDDSDTASAGEKETERSVQTTDSKNPTADWSWNHEPFADFTLEYIECGKAEEGISKTCWESEFSLLAGTDKKNLPQQPSPLARQAEEREKFDASGPQVGVSTVCPSVSGRGPAAHEQCKSDPRGGLQE